MSSTPLLSTSVSVASDGMLAGGVWGDSHQGEENTLRVCEVFVERLNQDGAAWGAPTYVPRDRTTLPGLDCIAQAEGAELWIAVTKALYSREIWKRLSKDKEVTISEPTLDAVAALWRAIETQSNDIKAQYRGDLLLALDAWQTPQLLPPAVVAAFVEQYGACAIRCGYKAIWLVGPIVGRTYRLDVLQFIPARVAREPG